VQLPILDGSALPWVDAIASVGICPAYAEGHNGELIRKYSWRCKVPISVNDIHGSFITIYPKGVEHKLTVGVERDASAIGVQWVTMDAQGHLPPKLPFASHFAAARTWVESRYHTYLMRDAGYLRGASVGSVRTCTGANWESGVPLLLLALSTLLDHSSSSAPSPAASSLLILARFKMTRASISLTHAPCADGSVRYRENEEARHNLCDLLGDISLLAYNGGSGLLLGHLVAYNADHCLQQEFVQRVAKCIEAGDVEAWPFLLTKDEAEKAIKDEKVQLERQIEETERGHEVRDDLAVFDDLYGNVEWGVPTGDVAEEKVTARDVTDGQADE
jgi:UDP-3-O-acyl-N-acetylglucosamine deacetylase